MFTMSTQAQWKVIEMDRVQRKEKKLNVNNKPSVAVCFY